MHLPVHTPALLTVYRSLGSMQFAIQYQHSLWEGKLQSGDVLLTNHPECGGTHLPDLTVVTPVFADGQLIFYVASRGHHTDIGGIGITSMIPDSKFLWQEGLAIRSLKIVSGGTFDEASVRKAFADVADKPGCSATRRVNDNISDLKAQIAANQRGITLLQAMCAESGIARVQKYMYGIQANAELAVRTLLKRIAAHHPTPLTATDYYDDGTPVALRVTIDAGTGGAVFDFAGTGAQTLGNMNAPLSITHSAVIYALRCLVDLAIPLNQGCLAPIAIRVPQRSILHPSPLVAVCGSTIASQRVADVILRCFRACAASQGCANSFGWGLGGKDPATGVVAAGWNYGEALGGGSGAGPGWRGADAVQVHSTNTKTTDVEVIERRTPVVVRQYRVREGTGGRGRWRGGDGVVREVEARVPLRFSILSERRVYSPYGLEGGGDGSVGKNYWIRRDEEGREEWISLGGKAVVDVGPGERVMICTPGECFSVFARMVIWIVVLTGIVQAAVDGEHRRTMTSMSATCVRSRRSDLKGCWLLLPVATWLPISSSHTILGIRLSVFIVHLCSQQPKHHRRPDHEGSVPSVDLPTTTAPLRRLCCGFPRPQHPSQHLFKTETPDSLHSSDRLQEMAP